MSKRLLSTCLVAALALAACGSASPVEDSKAIVAKAIPLVEKGDFEGFFAQTCAPASLTKMREQGMYEKVLAAYQANQATVLADLKRCSTMEEGLIEVAPTKLGARFHLGNLRYLRTADVDGTFLIDPMSWEFTHDLYMDAGLGEEMPNPRGEYD